GFGGDQFALIPPGSFRMGSTVTTRTDEGPVRTVTITRPFRMQRTEVTRAQWRSVMDSLPPQSSRCPIDACPVDAVSWREVQEFIRRLNLRDPGRAYRLPTEAQWEYAARAGATGLSPVAPGGLNASAWVTNVIWSWPVAVLLPNAFGLHDVVGNLWEWVADWYAVDYYTRAPAVDPPGPDSTGVRSYRGGAVGSGVARSTLSARGGGAPEGRFADVGFRLVRDP
ncbi:MAG: formylglycine-generating enzyme family protein, partial [Gemmatimonadaceae bacterium]|nr:formylglycine-generating enzyme family protein [Gemmatimonadaceae bacterium]